MTSTPTLPPPKIQPNERYDRRDAEQGHHKADERVARLIRRLHHETHLLHRRVPRLVRYPDGEGVRAIVQSVEDDLIADA